MRAAVYYKHGRPEDVLQAVEVEDPTQQDLIRQTQAQRKSEVAPDSMGDHCGWETMMPLTGSGLDHDSQLPADNFIAG
ncbi:hypothetical protein [Sinorhizobium sp. BG8]|uniref:hypothetical protein n=1 Tax=Sinorhizobium sp. BG8 TaxID=2613773 RepID=UPI00193D3B47|nr:hypothetical protein [Sinorhizobium sp. BG8]QRM57198.1 hypothetical protein F3Y30_22015 [Sinorhizobium sp. BG8]